MCSSDAVDYAYATLLVVLSISFFGTLALVLHEIWKLTKPS